MSSFRHLTGFPSFLRKPRWESPSNAKLSSMSRGVHVNLARSHVISTLNPSNFAEKKQQRLSIGNLSVFAPRVVLHKQSSPVFDQPLNYLGTLQEDVVHLIPFPSATNGFLYYSTSPDRPRISGELRFRLASTNDPTSFASGSDLCLENGGPWFRPLFLLPTYYPLLYKKLKEEKLVPADMDAVLPTLPSSRSRYQYSRSRFLYSLNDPFPVDFGRRQLSLTIVTEQGLETLNIKWAFTDGRKKPEYSPYEGRAWARLERSKMSQHKGTRTVVLRILKLIDPVQCVAPNYDGYISWPKEGQLHQRYYIKTLQPWKIDLDVFSRNISLMRALELLWDA